MIKKLTNKKIVLISATVIVVVLILGFTLALWSRNFTQTGTNTITSDCFNIEYSESEATSLINSYPQTDEDGLKNVSYDVTIENTCNTVTNYSVVLNELSTNTLSESHVKVAVNDSYKMLNTYESATPSADVDNASSARLLTQGVLGPEQEKTISIKSWMDEDTTELEGENKTFGYKITIEALAGTNKLLAAEVLNSNTINLTTPTVNQFKRGEPTATPGVSGITYKEVEETYTDTITMTTSKYIGSGYTFDSTTGRYTLTDYAIYTDEKDLADTYTCNNTSYNDCSTVYKTITYDSATITKSQKYTSVGSSQNGIFSAQDNDGTSYYLRGEINNNYVSFAGKLWRFVRINGDGTIRLILNEPTDQKTTFNTYTTFDKKYVGYTYDNSKICTSDSPCDGTEGTNSTIKTVLDNWYTTNLISYDSLIAASIYCNDTTYIKTGDNYTYGAAIRVQSQGSPTLECPDTNEKFGGSYKLKIGLISADELMMAGLRDYYAFGTSLNYMFNIPIRFWTGSPAVSTTDADWMHESNYGQVTSNSQINVSLKYKPVINLISDVKVSSGNGTFESPYVIDMN